MGLLPIHSSYLVNIITSSTNTSAAIPPTPQNKNPKKQSTQFSLFFFFGWGVGNQHEDELFKRGLKGENQKRSTIS